MKTVQEYLRELDTQKLVDTYTYEYPIKYEYMEGISDKTFGEIARKRKQQLEDLIERMKVMKVKVDEDGDRWILYAHKVYSDIASDYDYSLVRQSELSNKDKEPTSYAFELTEQTEIVGFHVADTALTQALIYELMAHVLREASFFGYRQEGLQEFLDSLERARQEEGIPFEELDLFPGDEEYRNATKDTPDELEYLRAAQNACRAYGEYSNRKELDAIRDNLK